MTELRNVYAEKIAAEAAKEVVSEVIASIVEGAMGETNPVGLTILALSVVAIIAYGIWNGISFDDTNAALQGRANNAGSETVDLAALTEPEGLSELLYVVTAETLDQESSAGACSFAAAKSCSQYRFAADPDFVSDRYGGQPVPAHTPADPHFILQQRDSVTTSISPSVEPPDQLMRLWSAVGVDASTNPVTYFGTTNWDPTATGDEHADLGAQQSHITNGLFVNSGGGLWRYYAGMDYVNWKGEWWNAWLNGNTFVHTRYASPVPGTYTPTDEVALAGIIPLSDGCVENPPFYFGFLEGFNPIVLRRGTCLLTSKGADTSSLHAGDRILVDGVIRQVTQVGSCYRVTFPAPFQTVEAKCQDHGGTAIILAQTGLFRPLWRPRSRRGRRAAGPVCRRPRAGPCAHRAVPTTGGTGRREPGRSRGGCRPWP